jgi:hypothetical protein
LLKRRVAVGPSTWYQDTSVKINFFRPLSSAAMAVNHRISGLKPLAYTLHSLGWYLALVGLFGVLVERALPDTGGTWRHPAAYIAVLMFAISSANCSTVMWSAARWLLIATTLGIVGLIAFVRWREDGWRPGGVLSIVALGLSLLAGEAALSVMAFVIAHQLFGSTHPAWVRFRSVLPTASLALCYLVIYKVTGHGSTGLEAYIDPVESPVAFLTSVPSKISAMLGELFLGFQSSLWYFPERRLETVLVGVVSLVLVAVLLIPCMRRSPGKERRTILWMAAGTVGSLIPLAARMPNPHVLIIPQIGTTLLAGYIVAYWWGRLRSKRTLVNVLGVGLSLIFVIALMVQPPFKWAAFGRQWQEAHDRLAGFHSQSVLNQLDPGHRAVFLNFNDWDLEFHGYYYRRVFGLPMPGAWWLLSSSPFKHTYRRTAPNTLEMEVGGAGLDVDPNLREAGSVRQLPGLEIEVLEVTRGAASKVRFIFHRPLEDESIVFLEWRDQRLRVVQPPQTGDPLVIFPASREGTEKG